jgi:hypothetical protein
MHWCTRIGLCIQVRFGGAFDLKIAVVNEHHIRPRGTRLAPTVCAVAETWMCALETLIFDGNFDSIAVAVTG